MCAQPFPGRIEKVNPPSPPRGGGAGGRKRPLSVFSSKWPELDFSQSQIELTHGCIFYFAEGDDTLRLFHRGVFPEKPVFFIKRFPGKIHLGDQLGVTP